MKLNTVGIALSYYREKYGLSMTQVCEGICSPATMFRIEEGYREVDSLVSATLLSRIGKQVLEFELLLNEKDYNLFRLRKDIHRNLEEKNLDTAEKLLQSYQSVMPKNKCFMNNIISGERQNCYRNVVHQKKKSRLY